MNILYSFVFYFCNICKNQGDIFDFFTKLLYLIFDILL